MTDTATHVTPARATQPRTYDARELMPDGNPAHIVLDDHTYSLRITRAGKLILTK